MRRLATILRPNERSDAKRPPISPATLHRNTETQHFDETTAMLKAIPLFAILGWFALGSPPTDIANLVWSDDAAPWESVDAIYYPFASDLSQAETAGGLNSVDACRAWVHAAAADREDPELVRGEYQCGVGGKGSLQDPRAYRVTLR